MKVRMKPGYLMRDVAGEKVLLPVGKACADFSKMMVLNETAAFVVEQLMDERFYEMDELADALTAAFEVDAMQARMDLEQLIVDLEQDCLVELEA